MEEEIKQIESGEPEQKESKPDQAALQKEMQHSLGNRLLQARERKGLSLSDVSEQLRIRKVYLESLEKGEWDELPEETYVRGFLKQYARLLNLDIGEELEALKPDEYHLTKPFTMPDPSIAPSRKWTIAVAAVFVLLVILFNVFRHTEERPRIAPPAPPEVLKPEKPQPTEAATPEQQSASPAKKEAPTVAESPTLPADMHHLRFTAVGESAWIQLFDEQHTLLKEALLKPGESLSLSYKSAPLFVTCGNAVALEIHADDKLIAAAGSLGTSGKVLRDYKLVLPAPSQ